MRGASDGNHRQVFAVGLNVAAALSRTLLCRPLPGRFAAASSAPPLANLANSVTHRVVLLG